jgi:regulator of replication initiation timing
MFGELSQKLNYLQQVEHELRQRNSFLENENATLQQQLDEFNRMNFESQGVISDNTTEMSRMKDIIDQLSRKVCL